jgi:hypothetical protein
MDFPNIAIDAPAVQALIASLDSAGVTYPAEVARAVERIDAYRSGVLSLAPAAKPNADLLAMDDSAFAAHVQDRAHDHIAAKSRAAEVVNGVIEDLGQQVIVRLRGVADELVDQVRAPFDAAVQAVQHAREVGITAATTAEGAIDLGLDAVEAWRGLPQHIATLDAIADMRGLLSHTLDLPPDRDPFDGHKRSIGAAFSISVPEWRGKGESSRAFWLRLADSGLELLSIEGSRLADEQARREQASRQYAATRHSALAGARS